MAALSEAHAQHEPMLETVFNVAESYVTSFNCGVSFFFRYHPFYSLCESS